MSEVSTQILHQSYTLTCPEGEERMLHQAVAQLDAAMVRHWESGKLRLREQAAVLVAVNMSVENLKLQTENADLRAQLAALRAMPAAALEQSLGEPVQATATPPLVDANDALSFLPAEDHSDLLGRIDAALAQHPQWPPLADEKSAPTLEQPSAEAGLDNRQGQLFGND